MDYAIDYWIGFWTKFLKSLSDMQIVKGVSLLDVLIAFIVIITILAFIFSQRSGKGES